MLKNLDHNKFLDAALQVQHLPEPLFSGLAGITLTVQDDGLHTWPEAAADRYLGKEYAFPVGGLFRLRDANLLQVGFGSCWYAILRVRAGRLVAPREKGRQAIPTAVSAEVRNRDGERCAYCKKTSGPFHLDHVLPYSRGGQNKAENLVVACASCNLKKRDRTPQEMGWAI